MSQFAKWCAVIASATAFSACKTTSPGDESVVKSDTDTTDVPNAVCKATSPNLNSQDTLMPGEALCNGNFTAVMQADGNFVVYSRGGIKTGAIWDSKTSDGIKVTMQNDCNLVMANAKDLSPWNTATSDLTQPKCHATMQPDGNFVVYNGDKAVWTSNTRSYCRASPRLDAGESVTQGEALCNGNFYAVLQADGDFVLYLNVANSPTPYWRANTKTGAKVSMQPDCNFVMYDAQGASPWNTSSADGANPKCFVQLQDDGNLVVYRDNDNKVIWNSDAARSLATVPADDQTFMVCKCSDMECWQRVTNERSANSFKCAANALGGAFPVLDLPIQIGLISVEILEARDKFKAAQKGLEAVEAAADTLAKTNDGTCVGGVASAIKGSAGLGQTTAEMTLKVKTIVELGKKGEVSMRAVKDVLVASKDLVIRLVQLGDDFSKMGKCIPESGKTVTAAKAWKEMTAALLQTQKAWGAMTKLEKFDVASRIATCSVDIFKGATALAENSYCLGQDLAKLQQSYDDLKAAREKVLASNAPHADPSVETCNGEPKNNSTYAMKKYGIWLYTKNNFSYTRSYECARYCSAGGYGPGSGQSYCAQYVDSFMGGESQGCRETCNTPQGDQAWDLCVSHCCGQDGTCDSKAHKKAGEYGFR